MDTAFHWLASVVSGIPAKNLKPTSKEETPAILVTAELDKAIADCKAKVAYISKSCRANNRKFRDVEFDLENDKNRCLHGLSDLRPYNPSDVQRVTQIFENPQFSVDGADSNDIVQGILADCWFLSALATMSAAQGLIEKFCVAQDPTVGVYGFIFFRDTRWVTVIVDDLLYTCNPKFEELNFLEKKLYHNEKNMYNQLARTGGKGLYFARSGTHGETWVPLLEKAYAKLHGSYYSLHQGVSAEAVEDLTGGVSSCIQTKDILDIDRFWKEELCLANKDRIFGCSFQHLDRSRNGSPDDLMIEGLMGGHSYSVLRAIECKGKRFVVLRNPWGASEWTGPWSDGSKEWTAEWLEMLPRLGHVFGDDGQFVMEYNDFLNSWEEIDRTLLFDSSWVMSPNWLRVNSRPFPSAWGFGDVSFTISLPQPSFTIIVLSQLDDRYFLGLQGNCSYAFDFVLFKRGEREPIGFSSQGRFHMRSVNLEIHLDAGDYVVHVRLDRELVSLPVRGPQNERTLSRVMMERAKSQVIASNFDMDMEVNNLPIPVEVLAGRDLDELDSVVEAVSSPSYSLAPESAKQTSSSEGYNIITQEAAMFSSSVEAPILSPLVDPPHTYDDAEVPGSYARTDESATITRTTQFQDITYPPPAGQVPWERYSVDGVGSGCHPYSKRRRLTSEYDMLQRPPRGVTQGYLEEGLVLGLRVYSNKDAPAEVKSQLRREDQRKYLAFAGASR